MKRLLLKPVRFSLDHPRTVLWLSLAVTIVLLAQFPRIVVDTDPENMLAHDEPVRVTHDRVKKEFALHDAIVIGVFDEDSPVGVFRPDTLERIAAVTDAVMKIDGVMARDVMSLITTDDIEAEAGSLRIEPLMGRTVESGEAALAVRDAALKNPILKDLLVSGDGRAVTIFVPIKHKSESYRISREIEAVTAKLGGGESYHITGLPVAEDTFGVEMFRQMGVSAPLAGLLIFILMLAFFRRGVLVSSAMIVAMMTVIWTMGLLIGAGYTVHIMSSMIPIFLMPIAVLDSIHILSEFHGRFPAVGQRRAAFEEVMEELFTPMLFTSLTSSVGFASLLFTPIPPVRVFGVFVALGIVIAWFLTITFIPAFVMVLPERFLRGFGEGAGGGKGAGTLMMRVQEAMGRFATRRAKTVLAACAVLFAVSLYGISKTVVNDNPVKWFHEGHPIRVADRLLNSHFGGTYMAYLVLDGGGDGVFKDPEALRYIERLQKALEEVEVVGKTTSVADVLKKMNFELRDEEPGADVLPSTARQAAQLFFLYEMSGDPEDLYHLVDPAFAKANIWVQLRSGDNRHMLDVERRVAEFMEREPPPPGIDARWAGLAYLNVVWQEKMVGGMLKALAGGGVTVLVIMMVLFRSVLWGLVSMIPLTLTIALIYGLIGFAGKDYDMPIAVLSSLTLGISVDFAIHMCQRTRQISAVSGEWSATVERVFGEPVRAIIRNMIVIAVGFLPLLVSPLVPYQTVGFFFAAIMAVSGVATLLVLPALMSVLTRPLGLGAARR
ncbi:MAG TPA: RND transporter [Deltaproteobacteria bacterium]|nr:RND transporter [Deltaproteobacteria bacterium]